MSSINGLSVEALTGSDRRYPVENGDAIVTPMFERNSTATDKILKDLQKDLPVPERTVIRWTSVHPNNGVEFHYVAIFAGGSWYTSVARDNDNVQKIMQHEDLIAYLNRKKNNLKNIEVAIDFDSLNW